MLKQLVKKLLEQLLNNIDSDNSNINESEQQELIELLQKITDQQLYKQEAANYIGVSRATFDNYIDKGLIPKGKKRAGSNSLSWNKIDLDKFNGNKQIQRNR